MSTRTWTTAEILQRYLAGERDFRGLDIEDGGSSSFRAAILDGADFSGAFLLADFERARLRGCRFVDANVKTCRFDDADLRGACFCGAALDATTFHAAHLDGTDFTDAHVQGHTLQRGEVPTW